MDKVISINGLKEKLQNATGIERIHILNELGKYPILISPNEAIKLANEALELSKEQSHIIGEALALKNMGAAYIYIGNCAKSIEYSREALRILEECNEHKKIPNILSNLGAAHGNLSDYDMALEYYFKELEYREKLGNEADLASCLGKIGVVYWCLENFESSLEFCEKAVPLYIKADSPNIAGCYVTMGLIYKEYNEREKSLDYLEKAYEIASENNMKDVISAALINIGSIYSELYDYDRALDYYLKSLEAHEQIGYRAGIATNLLYIGRLYLNTNEYDESLQYLQQGLDIALEVKIKKIIEEIYLAFSDYYAKLGNYKYALEYFKLHSETKDTMSTEEVRNKIARLQNKYEIQNKEKEKEIYRLKNIELAKANESLVRANEQIKQKNREIIDAYKKLELMAKTDYLTKLWNRIYILEKIEHEKLRFKENVQPFVLILADIDHFKQFNDKYGHECGDFVLTSLANDMNSMIRNIDCLARWGGEEFLFFLPETSLDEGYMLAEKIRKTISEKVYRFNDMELSITLTFGVYEYIKEESIEHCINLADEALYEGKKGTRNCVVKAKA